MAKNKVYAARFENGETQKFFSWEECRKAVEGVKKVQFKGFLSEEKADLWLEQPASPPQNSDNIKVYVDGSFTPKNSKAGWGWVAVKNNVVLAEANGTTLDKALSRNIDGELMACLQAIQWAKANAQQVTIVYDYYGIEKWATGEWKVNSQVAKNYVRDLALLNYPVNFEKVAGHSGDRWNDYADNLAQISLN